MVSDDEEVGVDSVEGEKEGEGEEYSRLCFPFNALPSEKKGLLKKNSFKKSF